MNAQSSNTRLTSKLFFRNTAVIICLILSIFFSACSGFSAVNNTDAKKQFCEWYFTSNYEERWTIVSDSPDVENSLKTYFSPVESITTEQFRDEMIRNRDPIKYDQLFIESGAQSYLETIDFETYEEKESYIVYEFTAVLKLENYNSLPIATIVSDDGQLILNGQITEEGGQVSKIYIRTPAEETSFF